MRVEKRSSSGIALCARNNSSCLIEKQFPNEIFWCAWTIHVWKTILTWELFKLIRDVRETIRAWLIGWKSDFQGWSSNENLWCMPGKNSSSLKTILKWSIFVRLDSRNNSSRWKTFLKLGYVVRLEQLVLNSMKFRNSEIQNAKRFSRLKLKNF